MNDWRRFRKLLLQSGKLCFRDIEEEFGITPPDLDWTEDYYVAHPVDRSDGPIQAAADLLTAIGSPSGILGEAEEHGHLVGSVYVGEVENQSVEERLSYPISCDGTGRWVVSGKAI